MKPASLTGLQFQQNLFQTWPLKHRTDRSFFACSPQPIHHIHNPNPHLRSTQSTSTRAEPPSQGQLPFAYDDAGASTPPSRGAPAPNRSRSEIDALTSLMRSSTVPDTTVARSLGLTEDHLQALMELPGTVSVAELKTRLVALSQWNASLRRGVLPSAGDVDWPQDPFRSKFLDVLKKLEMPRFTRRHPKLLASLLRQFLQLAGEFEGEMMSEEAKQQKQKKQQQQQQSPIMQSQSQGGDSEADQQQDSQQGGDGNSNADDPNGQPQEQSDQKGEQSDQPGEQGDIQMELEDVTNAGGGKRQPQEEEDEGQDASQSEADGSYADRLAESMLEKFEQDWSPAMEALEAATQAFDDIDALMDGPEGFDASSAVWHDSGWREIAALRRRLEALRELRDLVRSLGRGGGKGPLKRAPQQVYKSTAPPGVILSEQSPEETRGLTRSGDLSRMLPLEANLLAAGWPRRRGAAGGQDANSNRNSLSRLDGGVDALKELENSDENEPLKGGSRAARRLFMARRAERQLMSYERAGWVDNEPARVTGRLEMRPAAELGPIIVCLDTSGSMYGAREVVAKALTLEAMRGANRQSRQCYVYAFSGPGDVMELELGTDQSSVTRLLSFLKMSFNGGTDVDAPLALSLERLNREGWELADILMVTDGEINQPHENILERLKSAQETLGLRVHGLLVGTRLTDPMKELCTDLHTFKSWSAVGGRPEMY